MAPKRRRVTFRRMTLISEDELDRLRQRQIQHYNPTIAVMAKLQVEMGQILSSHRLTADQKLQLLSITNARFLKLKSNVTPPPPAPPAPPPPPDPVADLPAAALPYVADAVVADQPAVAAPIPAAPIPIPVERAVATKRRRLGDSFAEIVAGNPEVFEKGEGGELLLHGQRVPGSSYDDLVDSLTESRFDANLTGQKELFDTLLIYGYKPTDARNPIAAQLLKQLKRTRKPKKEDVYYSPMGSPAKAPATPAPVHKARRRPKPPQRFSPSQYTSTRGQKQGGKGGSYVLHSGSQPPGKRLHILRMYR